MEGFPIFVDRENKTHEQRDDARMERHTARGLTEYLKAMQDTSLVEEMSDVDTHKERGSELEGQIERRETTPQGDGRYSSCQRGYARSRPQKAQLHIRGAIPFVILCQFAFWPFLLPSRLRSPAKNMRPSQEPNHKSSHLLQNALCPAPDPAPCVSEAL